MSLLFDLLPKNARQELINASQDAATLRDIIKENFVHLIASCQAFKTAFPGLENAYDSEFVDAILEKAPLHPDLEMLGRRSMSVLENIKPASLGRRPALVEVKHGDGSISFIPQVDGGEKAHIASPGAPPYDFQVSLKEPGAPVEPMIVTFTPDDKSIPATTLDLAKSGFKKKLLSQTTGELLSETFYKASNIRSKSKSYSKISEVVYSTEGGSAAFNSVITPAEKKKARRRSYMHKKFAEFGVLRSEHLKGSSSFPPVSAQDRELLAELFTPGVQISDRLLRTMAHYFFPPADDEEKVSATTASDDKEEEPKAANGNVIQPDSTLSALIQSEAPVSITDVPVVAAESSGLEIHESQENASRDAEGSSGPISAEVLPSYDFSSPPKPSSIGPERTAKSVPKHSVPNSGWGVGRSFPAATGGRALIRTYGLSNIMESASTEINERKENPSKRQHKSKKKVVASTGASTGPSPPSVSAGRTVAGSSSQHSANVTSASSGPMESASTETNERKETPSKRQHKLKKKVVASTGASTGPSPPSVPAGRTVAGSSSQLSKNVTSVSSGPVPSTSNVKKRAREEDDVDDAPPARRMRSSPPTSEVLAEGSATASSQPLKRSSRLKNKVKELKKKVKFF